MASTWRTAALYATATSVALLVAGPLTGFLSDRVLRRRRLPYAVLTAAQFGVWVVFVLTLGRLPLWGLYALFFGMGLVGAAFVLTWPLGREVNPPELAGIAVAVVNLGGFVGAALTQGPLGALLDARWTGEMLGGARTYPVEAYRLSFAVSAILILCASLTSLFFRETHGQNVYASAPPPARRLRPRPLALARQGHPGGLELLRPVGAEARKREVERREACRRSPRRSPGARTTCDRPARRARAPAAELVRRITSSYAAMYASQWRRTRTSPRENFQCFSGFSRRARKRVRCSVRETGAGRTSGRPRRSAPGTARRR